LSERLPFALPGARPQYGPDRVVRVEHIDLWLKPAFATKTLQGRVTTQVRAIEDGAWMPSTCTSIACSTRTICRCSSPRRRSI
jgi:hypothetical protein